MRCPVCAERLSNQPAAVSFTSSRRVERYWCDHCRTFQKALIKRQFDLEDAEKHYSGPVTWDLSNDLTKHGYPAHWSSRAA